MKLIGSRTIETERLILRSSKMEEQKRLWDCQVYRKENLKGCSNPRVFEIELEEVFKDVFNKLLKKRNTILMK